MTTLNERENRTVEIRLVLSMTPEAAQVFEESITGEDDDPLSLAEQAIADALDIEGYPDLRLEMEMDA